MTNSVLTPPTREEWLLLAEVADQYPTGFGYVYITDPDVPNECADIHLDNHPEAVAYG